MGRADHGPGDSCVPLIMLSAVVRLDHFEQLEHIRSKVRTLRSGLKQLDTARVRPLEYADGMLGMAEQSGIVRVVKWQRY